jgi:tRNA(fMet)-specific endonuclease VapC
MTPSKDFLLDTNIIRYLVEIQSGEKLSAKCEKVKHNLESLNNPKMFLSVVSVGELKYGRLLAFEGNPSKQKITDDIMTGLPWWDINRSVAEHYYPELRKRIFLLCNLKKKTKRVEQWFDPATATNLHIQENDLWIAATAMAYNMILVTDDKMEIIKRVAGSEIEFANWCE